MSIYNPRFPHSVIVKREKTDSNGTSITDLNGDTIMETVLESVCGLRDLTNIDINSGIAQTDIKLSLPLPTIIPVWKVKPTDNVVFSNAQTGDIISGNVTKYRVNNIGINIYFHKNG